MSDISFTFASPALEANRIMWDEWQEHLTGEEYRIINFIYNRTYRFNKSAEVIPLRHFINGVDTEKLRIPGVGMTRRYVQKILTRLRILLVVIAQPMIGGATRYNLNLNLTGKELRANICNYDNGFDNRLGYFNNQLNNRLSRNPVSYSTPPRVLQYAPHPCPVGHPINKHKIETSINKHATPLFAEQELGKKYMVKDLDTVEQESKFKSLKARQKNKAKRNSTGLWKIWVDYMKEYYPTYPTIQWSMGEQAQAAKLFKNRLPDVDADDFLHKVIANWDYILTSHFSYIKNPPKYPTVFFLLKFLANFVQAYYRIDNINADAHKASNAEISPILLKAIRRKYARVNEQQAIELSASKKNEQEVRELLGKTLAERPRTKSVITRPTKPVVMSNGEVLPEWE